MKAIVTLSNLKSREAKYQILHNLSRIVDIRVLDIDLENRSIYFVYDSMLALEKAKRELSNIGYYISKCKYQDPNSFFSKQMECKVATF